MVPKLTAGAIQRIMNGEEVPKAVMQLLGYKRLPGVGSCDRYRLLLSDGSQFTPFGILGTKLNHMVENNELEKFTVIQIDKCVCNPVSSEEKVIIVLSVTVLVPGDKVGEKIGNPQIAGVPSNAMSVPIGAQKCQSLGAVNNSSNNTTRHTFGSSGKCSSEATDSRNTSFLNLVVQQDQTEIVVPKLTAGAIQRIMNDEEVPKTVMQLLGYKKVPGDVFGDRYRLILSDGSQFTPFGMLGTRLNHMMENNKLEKFTIIQIDKCVCHTVSSEKKVIIILSVTILVPGDEVGEMIGNPQNAVVPSDPSDAMSVPIGAQKCSSLGPVNNSSNNTTRDTYVSSGMCKSEARYSRNTSFLNLVVQDDRTEIVVPKLTAGAIQRIMNGEEVSKAVMQLLGYKKVLGGGSGDRYRLILSDSSQFTSFVMLGTQLNHMVANNELEKFTVIQIEKCVCTPVSSEMKVIIVLSVTVLVPGYEVSEKIGNPQNAEAQPDAVSVPICAQKDSLRGVNNNSSNNTTRYTYLSSGTCRYETSDARNISFLNFVVQEDRTEIVVPKLTAGAIQKVMNGEEVPKAVMQLLGYKKFLDDGSGDLYRLLLSDGSQLTSFGILGTQLNHMVANNELEKFTVIQIDKCVCNPVSSEKKIIIILSVTVLVPGDKVGEKIGNSQIAGVPSDAMSVLIGAEEDSSCTN